ncbi:MAG: HAD family hydrolase [Alphaproteobacteria bacterium]|nr:HAD family hydrolase [Alphaproteobacteria bacterium]
MVIPSLNRPRAILFDWDNTLVDTWPCIFEVLNTTYRAMGHEEWTLERFRAELGPSLRDSFPAKFGDRWEEARDIFYATFNAIHLQKLIVLPGAGELLATLHADGLYLGIVSNKTGSHLRDEVNHMGWSSYFGGIVGALDAERDKPAAEPVHLALAGSGVDAGSGVWFVGDSHTDLQCAVNAGCVPILLRPEPPSIGEFPTCPPREHVADCVAFRDLVCASFDLRQG